MQYTRVYPRTTILAVATVTVTVTVRPYVVNPGVIKGDPSLDIAQDVFVNGVRLVPTIGANGNEAACGVISPTGSVRSIVC
jgi:hypothetical protein